MFRRIDDFLSAWKSETGSTVKLFATLTDESLSQSVAGGHRTIARIAWHIVACIPGMAGEVGLTVAGPASDLLPPDSADTIRASFREAADSLAVAVKTNWTDATLDETDEMYGEIWRRGTTLSAIRLHQTHHRGQLTVLMRQAGLEVAGVYGPSKDEWAAIGMSDPTPEV
jgi:uncharacterized damage-inducible protein DinB